MRDLETSVAVVLVALVVAWALSMGLVRRDAARAAEPSTLDAR